MPKGVEHVRTGFRQFAGCGASSLFKCNLIAESGLKKASIDTAASIVSKNHSHTGRRIAMIWRSFIVLFFFLSITCVAAESQEYMPRLLGKKDKASDVFRTSKHGAIVKGNGFDQPRTRIVHKKTPELLRNLGVPEARILEFISYAEAITGERGRSTVGSEIDFAIDLAIARAASEGDPFGAFACAFDWSKITFEIMPRGFKSSSNPGWYVQGDATATRARVVAVCFNGLMESPALAYLNGLRWIAPIEAYKLLMINFEKDRQN
jgi:hypothetical protein